MKITSRSTNDQVIFYAKSLQQGRITVSELLMCRCKEAIVKRLEMCRFSPYNKRLLKLSKAEENIARPNRNKYGRPDSDA